MFFVIWDRRNYRWKKYGLVEIDCVFLWLLFRLICMENVVYICLFVCMGVEVIVLCL